ncbi:MAG: AraC family transcriptional regulator [Planctomycetota bacterium]
MDLHANDNLPDFVSRQVSEARRFFLNLSPDGESPVEVVCGGVELVEPDYVIDRDDFPYYAIEFVAGGAGTYSVNGRHFQLSTGSVFCYGPGANHEIRNQRGTEMWKYYLDFVGTRSVELLRTAGLIDSAGEYNAVTIGAVHELVDLFELVFKNTNEDGPLVAPICASLVELLALKTAQLKLPEGKSVPRSYATYERIRNHIDQRFLEVQTVREIAAECDVTPVYLSRLFGRFSDCSAYQYLLRRKMNYAAGLISDGLLVRDVACQLGMTDAFQFSRAFKRVFGIPPSHMQGVRKN